MVGVHAQVGGGGQEDFRVGLGLDGADRRYLGLMAENYGGGPVGVETLSAALSESRDAIEEVISYTQAKKLGKIEYAFAKVDKANILAEMNSK